MGFDRIITIINSCIKIKLNVCQWLRGSRLGESGVLNMLYPELGVDDAFAHVVEMLLGISIVALNLTSARALKIMKALPVSRLKMGLLC